MELWWSPVGTCVWEVGNDGYSGNSEFGWYYLGLLWKICIAGLGTWLHNGTGNGFMVSRHGFAVFIMGTGGDSTCFLRWRFVNILSHSILD